jgi:2-phospho-L-lactate guanylyltransferase
VIDGDVWAIVPAKSFRRAKSRLAPVLAKGGRAELARAMLERVLGAVTTCREVDHVLVLTDGEDVARVADEFGAHTRRDTPGAASLAAVVDAGLMEVAMRGASAAIVLMADLPRLEPHDVHHLVRALVRADVVIAADVHGTGTNALGVRLAHGDHERVPFRTGFGSGRSFAFHVEEVRRASRRLVIVRRRPRLARDLDLPADLMRERAGAQRRAGERASVTAVARAARSGSARHA